MILCLAGEMPQAMEELRARSQHESAIRPFGISQTGPCEILNSFLQNRKAMGIAALNPSYSLMDNTFWFGAHALNAYEKSIRLPSKKRFALQTGR